MTEAFASTSVQISAIAEPQVGSFVVALVRSMTMRTTDAAMTKAPRPKMEISPVFCPRASLSVRISGIGIR